MCDLCDILLITKGHSPKYDVLEALFVFVNYEKYALI